MVKMRVLLPSPAALAMLMLQGVSGASAPRPGVDWPQFRGIRASGIDDRHSAPSSWDVAKNQLVRWKTPIPGLGHASPVIWGDTLYIATSISGQKDAGLKVGYIAQWMKDSPATGVDRAAMETIRKLGMNLKEVTLPDWPHGSLIPILFAEGAASFEELALNNQLGTLKVQVKDAWPNLFRQARFLSAVDFVQADRLRRKIAFEMARIFREVDVLLVPSLRDEQLTITNFTGHPSLTLRAGFVQVSEARSDWAPDPANPLPTFNPPRRVPHGITLVGRLFDDGLLGQVGLGLERSFMSSSGKATTSTWM